MKNIMNYKKDSSKNDYLLIPLGWDDDNASLRVTFIENQKTIRMNKIANKNHVFPGPEIELRHIPKLIEALKKIYNDNS